MKTLFVTLLLTGAAALSAHAESFTGSTTSTSTGANMFQPAGAKPVGSFSLSFTGQTVWAGGKTTDNKGTCTFWTTPPGSIFDTNGVCNYTDANGDTSALLAGCDWTSQDRSEGDCWAGLTASAGPHAGKRGTISWHQKTSADGKTGTATTVGQWND